MAGNVVLILDGALERATVAALCERLRAALAGADADDQPVICDLGRLVSADLATVDALARLQLTARRHGRRLLLRRAGPELQALLRLTGLAEVLPTEPAASGQPRRQAEQRKEAGGIEEEGDATDPPVA